MLARFAPEWCALSGYLLGRVFLFGHPSSFEQELEIATAFSYALAGFLALVVPIGIFAGALVREKDRGTMEALVLTPLERRRLVWSRFWALASPWLRFFAYMLPLYFLIAGSSWMQDAGALDSADRYTLWLLGSFAAKPLAVWQLLLHASMSLEGYPEYAWSIGSVALTALRMLSDASVFVFVAGCAYYISARARNFRWAITAGYLLIPLALCTVLALDTWWSMSWWLDFHYVPLETTGFEGIHAFFAVGGLVARFGIGLSAVHLVARKFDYYALGKKSA